MIRINLISQAGVKPRRRAPAASLVGSGQKITVACTLILALAALGTGWWYWSLRKEAGKLKDDIAAAETETRRLQTLIVQVRQFEARKAQLQERVTLIETLRRGQSSPVHVLDAISRSVPDMLWLTQLDQKGQDLTIEGRCLNLTSISDFVDNLGRSGWFKKPVEIVDSQVEQGSAATGELIKFTIKAQVVSPAG
ncbi:MAG: PilN domain-containing protein [Rhodospirillaceae bacterium]